MTGITHKQAGRYMRKDLDGLLTAAQSRDLTAHLDECEACRLESESFSLLTARLKTDFQARWDTQHGPSTNVMANVQSQTRRIIMKKRIDFAFNIFGGVVTLLVLAFVVSTVVSQFQKNTSAASEPQVIPISPPSDARLIAFTSNQDGNLDIYTMYADGSELTNLTNSPAQDVTPVWSPDGTRLAFVSDRDGNENIYVMNFDGSGLTRLTDDPASDTVPIWSPDGTKIAYASGEFNDKNTNIYVMDSNGQNHRRLTDHFPKTVAWPGLWSADSQFIFFEAYRQIFQVNATGGDVRPITPETDKDIPWKYVLAKDGSTLSYLIDCRENVSSVCYELWSIHRDGTQQRSLAALKTPEPCEVKQTEYWTGFFSKWSPDQTKILFAFTCEENGWLYIANADGSDFKPLTNYPVLGNGPDNEVAMFDWSPDSQSIVFMSALDQPGMENLYLLSINDAFDNPSIRPTRITNTSAIDSSPAWQPVIVEEESTPEPLAISLTVQESEMVAGVDAFETSLIGFNMFNPSYLPEGYVFQEATYDSYTQTVILTYASPSVDPVGQGTIHIYQKRGDFPKETDLPSYATPVPVGDVLGEFTHGAWIYESGATTPRWDGSADYYSLSWQKDGISFMVDFIGGEGIPNIQLNGLRDIAESLK